MRHRRLCISLTALTLALGAAPAAEAAGPPSSGAMLVALHLGHGGFARGGGLFRRSPSSPRGAPAFGGRRTSRSHGLLRRIGHALAIGYLLHLLFGGGGGIILLIVVLALFFAYRRRRRARLYGGAWR